MLDFFIICCLAFRIIMKSDLNIQAFNGHPVYLAAKENYEMNKELCILMLFHFCYVKKHKRFRCDFYQWIWNRYRISRFLFLWLFIIMF